MTEVNRSNYEEMFPKIIEQLGRCNFISIDAEYTGMLPSTPENVNSLFDTPAERYRKLRETLSKFLISQVGLSLYEKDWDGNYYHVDTYNIYVFPVCFDEFGNRDIVQCQVSCLNFLTANNFDYNKFIKEGVPYLKKSDAIKCRQYIMENPTFMRYMEVHDKGYFPMYNPHLKDDDEVDEIVDRLLGFTKVLTAIGKSGKPLIGHNMFMDLLLLYQQFHETLPQSYEEFKSKTHELYPVIFDTKHIAAVIKNIIYDENSANAQDVAALKDTNLFTLFSKTYSIRDINMANFKARNGTLKYADELNAGSEENLNHLEGSNHSSYCHEAGFDACVTGILFFRLIYIYARHYNRQSFVLLTATETLTLMKKWKDQVFIARSTNNYIDFSKPDPEMSKPNWIRVDSNPETNIPLDIPSLQNELRSCGNLEVDVLSCRSIRVACNNWECARRTWKLLESKGLLITTLAKYSTKSNWKTNFIRGAVLLGSTGLAGLLFWSWKKC